MSKLIFGYNRLRDQYFKKKIIWEIIVFL